MALENYFGSQNLFFGDKSFDISYQDPSVTEGSSRQGLLLDFSQSTVQMPDQNAQSIPGSINVQSNLTNSGTSFNESSLITGVDSSQGHGFNCVQSVASISEFSAVDQLSSPRPPYSQTACQGFVPSMSMFDNSRSVTMQEEPLHPNNLPPQQSVQSKSYNDQVTESRLLHLRKNPQLQRQNPHQCQQSPYQQQPNPYQPQQVPYPQQQAPYQQQQNPNQPQQNPNQPRQNPHQLQQNPHQQLCRPPVQPQQAANTVVNDGDAIKRLMSCLHYRRNRPLDNNIVYWRSFVNHYFSPLVKKTTCFSKKAHFGNHARSDFAQMETRKCGICGSAPGKGFTETFDVLPRMNQLYFNSSGVIDELMYITPTERRLRGGFFVVFSKSVQESIYNDCRVVHEGKLRVIFTPQLQIICWNFCVQHHEVFMSHRFIASQVNHFVSEATRCESNDDAEGPNLPSNVNRVEEAGCKLAAALEQPHVDDWGLPTHFVRSLQVSGVLSGMKDLMDSSLNNHTGPIETLEQYGAKSAIAKLETRYRDCRSPMLPRPCPYKKAQSSSCPSSIQISPDIEKMMINDLLAHIQGEETKRARTANIRPNLQGGKQKKSKVDSSQVNNELVTGHARILDGKMENGILLDSSCSSNSSRLLPECNFLLKGTTDSDDDLTSQGQTRGLSKNSDRPQ